MKIVYDHQIFNGQKYGGVSRYFYEIANRLSAENGCDIEIFAPLFLNEYLSINSDISITGRKIPDILFSEHIGKYIGKGLNTVLCSMMVKHRKDIDIFHETYFSRANNCPRSAKCVITVYDMIHERFPHHYPSRDRTSKIKSHAVHRADHVICISENTRQDLIELLGVPEKKTSVVYLGHSLACEIDYIKPIGYDKKFILYVGKRYRHKNFDVMLRAYASSKSLKNEVSIICFGGGEITRMETEQMASLNLPKDCVKNMSGDDSVLAGLYASAKAFIYPSLYEGFGIPPLEAMAFGCPVVCANTSSLPEVVGDAAELFDPASESDMCAAIEKVVFSPECAARLAARGHERIELFSWEKCARETLSVYEKVLGNNL